MDPSLDLHVHPNIIESTVSKLLLHTHIYISYAVHFHKKKPEKEVGMENMYDMIIHILHTEILYYSNIDKEKGDALSRNAIYVLIHAATKHSR